MPALVLAAAVAVAALIRRLPARPAATAHRVVPSCSGLRKEVMMPVNRCAVVDGGGIVVNVVMIDPGLPPDEQWQAPTGTTVIASDEAGIGWIWDGTSFIDPSPPPPQLAGAPDVD